MDATARNRGMALVVVMCLTALAFGALAVMGAMVVGSARRSRDMVRNEQAFYVAEGAVERAVQHIADGGTVPITLTGTLGEGTYAVDIELEGLPAGGYTRYRIESEGTVGPRTRRVAIRGVRAVSWARYALWYDGEAVQLWMIGGEQFFGPVHANAQFRFHSYQVAALGQTRFFDQASSTHATYEIQNAGVNPVFDKGIVLNAPAQSTMSVDFNQLRTAATLVLEGRTDINLSGNQMIVSNSRQGWNNHALPIPSNGSVFVETSATGYSSTRPGDIRLSGADGMSGRLTIVAERDIQIVDHVRYADNPMDNPDSEDALGLVARRHVMVQTNAPDNLEIFAHMIAAEGGFGVANYTSSALGPRGVLTVYGGIVNHTRQAVGSTAGTGYSKNYIYDGRFHTKPPPGYPVLPFAYQWTSWEDR